MMRPNTFRFWYAYSNFAQLASSRNRSTMIVNDVAEGAIHSTRNLSETCYLISVNPEPDETRSTIAHNAKAFDLQFILQRAIKLKWDPQLILIGLNIISMRIHHIHFLDSVSYLPMPLRKLPEAFGLSSSKSYYPHLIKIKANLEYVVPYRTYDIMEPIRWGEGEKGLHGVV